MKRHTLRHLDRNEMEWRNTFKKQYPIFGVCSQTDRARGFLDCTNIPLEMTQSTHTDRVRGFLDCTLFRSK